jgi:hypothetical protein
MMALGCASTLVGQDSSSQKQHSLSFHLEMALQAESYSNGDSTYFIAKARRAESGFTIREGKILVEGIYEQYLEYNLEVGSASCLSGGFIVMVLRGFEMNQECVQLLTAEKPLFAMKYSPCHPLGAKVEFERDFGEHSGLLAQLVVAEGTGGTLDDEHDINIGVHYRTPFPGFTLASSYTFWKWNAPFVRKDSILAPGGARDDYTIVWIEDKAVYDGYRAIVGFDYDASNLQLRGEAFIGKAYKDLLDIPYYAEIWADSSNATKIAKAPFEELEMNAFLVQAGYTLPLNNGRFSYLQPYIQYQWWDQAANLDGDYQSAFLTIGFNVGIGPGDARFRIDYQTCLSFAGDGGLPGYGEDQHADRLLARLQVGI